MCSQNLHICMSPPFIKVMSTKCNFNLLISFICFYLIMVNWDLPLTDRENSTLIYAISYFYTILVSSLIWSIWRFIKSYLSLRPKFIKKQVEKRLSQHYAERRKYRQSQGIKSQSMQNVLEPESQQQKSSINQNVFANENPQKSQTTQKTILESEIQANQIIVEPEKPPQKIQSVQNVLEPESQILKSQANPNPSVLEVGGNQEKSEMSKSVLIADNQQTSQMNGILEVENKEKEQTMPSETQSQKQSSISKTEGSVMKTVDE